jgi:hypothetical protein
VNFNKSLLLALGFIVATGVVGSILSPSNTIQILGFCGIASVGLLGMIKADTVAEKVEQVRVDQVKTNEVQVGKLTKIEETGEKVHTLVNSNMGVQLRLNAALSRQVANLTINPEEKEAAIRAAELAESLLHEHEIKQTVVDRKDAAKPPSYHD